MATTVIWFVVRVPVLSEQMTVVHLGEGQGGRVGGEGQGGRVGVRVRGEGEG